MKKFKFTLEAVHNVRELKQETEQLRLSEFLAEADRAAREIEALERAYQQALADYAEKVNCGRVLNIGEMEMNAQHLTALERRRRDAIAILADKRRLCAIQTEQLAAATREVKVTAKLRENQMNRHRLESDKLEQTALDELVSANFARDMRAK